MTGRFSRPHGFTAADPVTGAGSAGGCTAVSAPPPPFKAAPFPLLLSWRMSREQARRAVTQFAFSEGLLNRIATHLNEGLMQVDAAQTSTLQVMSLLTHWREGS